MLNSFRNLRSLLWSHGVRWLMFRAGYALRKRTGFIRKQMPAYPWTDRPLETWLKKGVPSTPKTYAKWRRQNSPRSFFEQITVPEHVPWNAQIAVSEAERILDGELKYFAHKFIKTGFPPDWHKDPISGIKLDGEKHWSEISDEGEVDIKFVWEASRFSMVYTLVRAYVFTKDEKFAEAFWTLIESWADANPPNSGPNWMDGQEAALRLMAWSFGFYAFLDSPSTTPQRIAQFTVMVATHAERIDKNVDYAISTHSNHTISEAFGLWLTGLLFPELKDSEKYLRTGYKLLEREAAAQIFPDGSYSMYSLNYHRFILHIYLCMIRLAEINQSPRQASSLINDRISASINYLSQLTDPQTGNMPVYGSNDGALVLALNNCDVTDYRPLLQLGSYLTKKKSLFQAGPWDEDIFWLCGHQPLSPDPSSPAKPAQIKSSFPHGGIYLLHDTNSKAIIRCTDYRSRPSHADQLHVDLWLHGKNIACDAGTYLYSGESPWRNGLAHTAVHNTVMVDHQDQMKMLTRFTWTDWAKGNVLRHDENSWQGEHEGYKRLPDPVHHKRTVLSLGDDRWLVMDYLTGRDEHHYALHWLLSDFPFQQEGNSIVLSLDEGKYKVQVGSMDGTSIFSIVRGDANSTRGWRSRYYGEREPAISLMLESDQPQVRFWTFIGPESDAVELTGDVLHIHSKDWSTKIDLNEVSK